MLAFIRPFYSTVKCLPDYMKSLQKNVEKENLLGNLWKTEKNQCFAAKG